MHEWTTARQDRRDGARIIAAARPLPRAPAGEPPWPAWPARGRAPSRGKAAPRGTAPAGGKAPARAGTAARAARPGQSAAAQRVKNARPAEDARAPATAAGRGPAAVAAAWRASLRWAGGGLPLATLVVTLLGLADAAYLTYQHFTEATSFAGCSDKGTINCVAVTTSAWSYLPPRSQPGQFGIPVSVLGLAFFAFMVAVNSPWGWRSSRPAVHW